MQIYIQHKGQQCGPFSEEQVHSGLAEGIYQLSDLAWYEGAAGWLPLSTVAGFGGSGPPGLPGYASGSGPQTSRMAIWSLVLGILAFFTLGLTGIPAIICGHLAQRNIKRSAGMQSGGGLAIAGLVTGYIGFFILGIAFLAGLAGFAAPLVIRQRKKADQTEAVGNARSFGIALFEFKTEYGSYPKDSTAAAVASKTETLEISGSSSNARFRQLIRAGISPSETPFYAHISGARKPDHAIDGSHALEKGECGFAYVGNLLASDEVARPIAMAPMIPGTDCFDPGPFDGKAVILWTDNSVRSMPIERASGHVLLDGKNLFDRSHPIWGGKAPAIAWPE